MPSCVKDGAPNVRRPKIGFMNVVLTLVVLPVVPRCARKQKRGQTDTGQPAAAHGSDGILPLNAQPS